MQTKALEKWLNIVSEPKKAIALAIMITIAIIIIYLLYRVFRGQFTRIRQNIQDNTTLQEEIITGGGLTYKESEYKQFADRLFNAMDGVGTNEQAIYDVFGKMKTKADVLKLIAVYGVKDDETLSQWLYGDLSTSEIATVNNILSTQQIDYQF